jgi:hypothetical protein
MREITIGKQEGESSERLEKPTFAIKVKNNGRKKPVCMELTLSEAINLKNLLVTEVAEGMLKIPNSDGTSQYIIHSEGKSEVIEGYESYIKVAKPTSASAARIYLPVRLSGRTVKVIVIDPPSETSSEDNPELLFV